MYCSVSFRWSLPAISIHQNYEIKDFVQSKIPRSLEWSLFGGCKCSQVPLRSIGLEIQKGQSLAWFKQKCQQESYPNFQSTT